MEGQNTWERQRWREGNRAREWKKRGREGQKERTSVQYFDDCSHEIKRRLLLGRKVMTNLDSALKSKDITLPTKVRLVKAIVFPVVMYGCESWTIKKAEWWRIDAFELWCWRRLLRVPWTARRSNQSILKEISLRCSLEGLIFFRMDWLNLLAVQGTLKSLLQHHNSTASILWRSAFFSLSLASILDYWKNNSLD